MQTTSEIVALLQKASDTYYNDGTQMVSDSEYDRLREELEEREPNHPFLQTVGAPLSNGVRLSYLMPSLTKIKPGTGQVENFEKSTKGPWSLSEKLDGVSVLLDYRSQKERRMYLRGDGVEGVDISWVAYDCQGIPVWKESVVLRGEVVVLPSDVEPGTLARSWVNGLLHRKGDVVLDEVRKLHFVAYQVIEPKGLTRSSQFSWLESHGYKTPWNSLLFELVDSELCELLLKRRDKCLYAMDVLVLGSDSIPIALRQKDTLENPKDMRAFKMVLEDQQAKTTVVAVEWNPSAQGYWIPRIQIQPVLIGGSRIEFLTGHNARNIVDQKIGRGAKILIRKSGDVIPTLEKVLEASSEPIELPKGVWQGEKHLKISTEETSDNYDVLSRRLEHFASVLDIPHLGPGLVEKLMKSGIQTPGKLAIVSQGQLESAVGKGMAAKIYPTIQKNITAASEMTLMIASSCMRRGVGTKKLQALFDLQTDPRLWLAIRQCEGWSASALQEFYEALPSYEAWRKEQLPQIPYPVLPGKQKSATVSLSGSSAEIFCMTGFRSSTMEDQLRAKGHGISQILTKKVSILILASPAMLSEENEKIKKAKENGIRIFTRDQIETTFLK